MPVVNPIIFKVTDAGRDAAAYAFNNLPGGKLSLSAIKVGLAKYSTVGNETSLQNPLPNTFSIGGGGVQVGSGQIRFTPILASLTRIEAFEIGLFTDTGVLFAIAATPSNTPLLVIEPDIEAIFTMNVALTNVDPDSIEIVVDVNAPLAVVMMGQHISAAHPHSQYKRTNDASERLKVANGVDNDEAVSKGQLDGAISTEAGIRANADDALQTAINGKANTAGSSTQTFSVAVATANDHAVRKEQFDAKTGISTDTIAGIVEKATQAEMNAGTNNVWPDAATIFNGFVQSGTTNGYIKLPEWMGGLIIQWDSGTAAPATTINFPITFPTACYVVVGCDRGSYNGFGTTGAPNQSGFVLASDTPSLEYQYVAIGK